jgi:hypothetical protein
LDLRLKKWQEAGEYCVMRSIITCTIYQILSGKSNQGMRLAGHVARMGDVRSAYNIFFEREETTRKI